MQKIKERGAKNAEGGQEHAVERQSVLRILGGAMRLLGEITTNRTAGDKKQTRIVALWQTGRPSGHEFLDIWQGEEHRICLFPSGGWQARLTTVNIPVLKSR